MTPEEAVEHFVAIGIIAIGNDYACALVLNEIKTVVAAAKADEARRCVARVKQGLSTAEFSDEGRFVLAAYTEALAEDILRTGGLELEE